MARGNDTENTKPSALYLTRGTGTKIEYTPFQIPKGTRVTTKVTKKAEKPKAEAKKEEPKAGDIKEKINNLDYKGLNASQQKSVKEKLEKIARGEDIVPKTGEEFDPDKTRGGIGHSAYIRAKEAGLLPKEGKYGTVAQMESDPKRIVAFAKDLTDRLSPERQGVEHIVMLDRQGRVITAASGNQESVGAYPSHKDAMYGTKYGGQGMARIQKMEVEAGGTSVHNHPYGETSLDKRTIGMPLSGGDFGSTLQKAEAMSMATSKEGTYVIRNPNWQSDLEGVRSRYKEAAERIDRMPASVMGRDFEKENAARRSVMLGVGNKAQEASQRFTGLFNATVGRLRAEGKVPPTPFNTWKDSNFRELSRTYLAASKVLAGQYGMTVDFIPNKGYEDINQ